jgi:hypothetical protein
MSQPDAVPKVEEHNNPATPIPGNYNMKSASTYSLFVLTLLTLLFACVVPSGASSTGGATCRATGKDLIEGTIITVWHLECGSTCSGGTDACSIQTDIINDTVWCGCSGATIDCCHLIAHVTFSLPGPGYTINSWDFDGDCLSCVPNLGGACQVIHQDHDTPETKDDTWVAICD